MSDIELDGVYPEGLSVIGVANAAKHLETEQVLIWKGIDRERPSCNTNHFYQWVSTNDLAAWWKRVNSEHHPSPEAEVRVNFRWQQAQVDVIKRAAALMGIPYQTYLKLVSFRAALEDIKSAQQVAAYLDELEVRSTIDSMHKSKPGSVGVTGVGSPPLGVPRP